jgi:hypothetical protein
MSENAKGSCACSTALKLFLPFCLGAYSTRNSMYVEDCGALIYGS